MADVEDVGERSFAAKLNHLFETVVPVGRGPFRTEEVARAISSGSVSISGSYIWLLRKGSATTPPSKHVEALARFFGVPPAYFFDDRTTQAVDGELELMVALRSAGVQHVALRAAGLSPGACGASRRSSNTPANWRGSRGRHTTRSTRTTVDGHFSHHPRQLTVTSGHRLRAGAVGAGYDPGAQLLVSQ